MQQVKQEDLPQVKQEDIPQVKQEDIPQDKQEDKPQDKQEVKQQDKQEGQPKPAAPLVDVHVKVGPWIEFLDRRRKRLDKDNADAKLTDKEKAAKKEREKMRQMALTAFKQGDDTINLNLRRSGDQVDVKALFGEGILRFVGSLVADFAAEDV